MSPPQDFSRHVAGFKPRVWKDALPLVDLLRGVLLYLLGHMEEGVKVRARHVHAARTSASDAPRQEGDGIFRMQGHSTRRLVRPPPHSCAQLAREYATRDALAAQEADRKLVREQAAAELARTREQWDTEAAASAAALKEQLRKQLVSGR